MIKDLVNSIERNSTVGEGTNENEKCASVMVEKHLKYHICEISKKNAILKSDLCESSASGSNFSHSLTFIANDGQGGGSPPLPSPPLPASKRCLSRGGDGTRAGGMQKSCEASLEVWHVHAAAAMRS